VISALRLAVAAVIIVLLARAARAAWHNRRIAPAVWRRIRVRHVAGSLALLAVVLGIAVGLMTLAPVTGLGLGSLIGMTSNAVFAPVEEAAARSSQVTGPAAETVASAVNVVSLLFLGGLLVLFPWLAFVEESVFREGLEAVGTLRRLWSALRFGLLHLVMLVPLAAALAIAVAGLWYGHIYLRAYAATEQRDEAVLASTVWHTTFNSTIVVLLIAGFATGWL
jgi:hypothetical protein